MDYAITHNGELHSLVSVHSVRHTVRQLLDDAFNMPCKRWLFEMVRGSTDIFYNGTDIDGLKLAMELQSIEIKAYKDYPLKPCPGFDKIIVPIFGPADVLFLRFQIVCRHRARKMGIVC